MLLAFDGVTQIVECGTLEDNTNPLNIQFESKYQNLVKSKDTLIIEDGMFENLPIVFHIIHEGDSLGSSSNPRVESVRELIKVTNDYFRQQNSQQNSFENPYYGADTQISFCLAGEDEGGNPSAGIMRYVGTNLNNSFLTSIVWDREKYINVFLNDFGGGCGLYSGGSDIISLINGCTGNSTLAHELGHYLGLSHTFGIEQDCGSTDCTLTGDRVCDTPPKFASPVEALDGHENEPCAFPANSCTTDEDDSSQNNPYRAVALGGLGDQPDPNSNIMGYARSCRNNFTQGQALKMQLKLLENRESLWKQESRCSDDLVFLNDAGIDRVSVIEFEECSADRVMAVALKNLGQNVLTSATIDLIHQNRHVESFEWQGALQTGQSEEVMLSRIHAMIGKNIVEIKVHSPNSKEDEDAASDFNYLQFSHFDTEIDVSFYMQDIVVCDQDSIEIGVLNNADLLNLNYIWRRENEIISDSLNKLPSLTISESDTYYLTVYKEDFSCATEFEALIVFAEKELEMPLQIKTGNRILDCDSEVVTLWAKNYPVSADINWYLGDTQIGSGESIQVYEKGEYRFEAVYETIQCAELKTFSHWILVEDGSNNNISFHLEQSDLLSCNDSPIFLVPSKDFEDLNRYSYTWSFIPALFLPDSPIDINPEQHPLFFENGDPRKLKISSVGTYSLVIKDRLTNCSFYAERIAITFGIDPLYFFRFPFTQFAPFQNGVPSQITGIVAQTGPEIKYSWSSEGGSILEGGSTLTPIVKGFGIYKLLLTNMDTDCNTELVIPLYPDLCIQIKGACKDGDLSDIQEPSVEVSLPQNDIFDLSINWYDSSGIFLGNGREVSISEPGEYHVEVTSGVFSSVKHFTVAMDYFDIPQSIIAPVETLVCPGQEMILDGRKSIGIENNHFEWFGETGDFISDSLFALIDHAGTYSLRVRNLTNGCFAISEVNVETSYVQADAGDYQVLDCFGDEVELGRNENAENYEFIWSRLVDGDTILVDTSVFVYVNDPGIYILEAKNTIETCSTFDQVEVFEKNSFIDISVTGAQNLCEDSVALLSLANLSSLYFYDLNWTLPDETESSLPLIQATQEGDYMVQFIDLKTGCEYLDTFILNQPFSIFLEIDTIGNSLSAIIVGDTGPYVYEWSNGAQSENIQNLEPRKEYVVTVTDANACSNIARTTFPGPTSIGSINEQYEVLLFPNPNAGVLSVQLKKSDLEFSGFTVYNNIGQEVVFNKLSESKRELQIDMQSNPSGLYILKADIGSKVLLRKFVLIR